MNPLVRILFALGCSGWVLSAYAVTETRMHEFGRLSPQMVESRIRMLVPERERVSINPQAGKVIVVAPPEVQEQIAAMIRELSKPKTTLLLSYRHNRERQEIALENGSLITLPVSTSPPPAVVEAARRRLPPGQERLPLVGSVLHVHVHLLREEPPVARLSITPAVLFGETPPYEVYRHDRLRMDVLINTKEFLDLPRALSTHAFYSTFLRTRPQGAATEKPVALLLSLEAMREEVSGESTP